MNSHCRKARSRARGATLIEALAATLVLVVGILGALQSFIVAARQNAMADTLTRGTVIASALRDSVELRGLQRLRQPGAYLDGANCVPYSSVTDLLPDTLPDDSNPNLWCVLDFDALEGASADPLVPGYSAADQGRYRRIGLVFTSTPGDPALSNLVTVAVVVSWPSGDQRNHHSQFTALENITVTQAGVEL